MFNSTGKSTVTGFFSPVKRAAKAAGAAVKEAAADVMSLPARMKAKKQIATDTQNFNDLKMVNQSKGKPDSGDYTDPLFRARVNAKNIEFDAAQKAAKTK